jgi:hypothetical protein
MEKSRIERFPGSAEESGRASRKGLFLKEINSPDIETAIKTFDC